MFPWWVKLDWRAKRRWIVAVCAVELPITVAALTLFGIADPNTYRVQLWAEGHRLGFNSSPKEILYAVANYRPIPVPTPWAQFVTDWNVVISVLSTFILIVKTVMFLTHTLPPLFSAVLHLGLLIVWCYSASLQAAPDYSDPKFPSPSPWYLRSTCGDPVLPNLQGYCMQAKAAFAVTILEIVLFFGYFTWSVVSSIPSKEQKAKQAEKEQEKREWEEIENFDDKQFNYELDQMHLPMQSPGSAVFPTGAGVLQQPSEGKEGLRHSVTSMGTAPEAPNKDLPLRHHFTSDVYA